MFLIITGVSGSGKSEYAEQRAMELAGSEPLCYLATMRQYGEEGRRRVERHRKQREGKGFVTLEACTQVDQAVREEVPEGATVLLECMSNLLANEMYRERQQEADAACDAIMLQIEGVRSVCRNLVIVTNEVFSDGVVYDVSTEDYLTGLGRLNRNLAAMADQAVEVVYSIPVFLKGEK